MSDLRKLAEAAIGAEFDYEAKYAYRLAANPQAVLELLAEVARLQAEVARLRGALWNLLNDCINFDDCNLTEIIMKEASDALAGTNNES